LCINRLCIPDHINEVPPHSGEPESFSSWLQDTLKRKLVDFAWNRRFFLFTRRVLTFFRVNPAKSFNQPGFFLLRSACFDQSSGQPRVNPGKQEGGGGKKNQKSASFLFEVSCSQRRPLHRRRHRRQLMG